MRSRFLILFGFASCLQAHDLSGLGYDPHGHPPDLPTSAGTTLSSASGLARIFAPFAPAVSTREDGRYLYVNSTGFPDHPMMKGIRNWQQQIPIPQDYSGENSWRLPLQPVPASSPAMIRGRFLRGAIALAANGVPIFNPQNNRGEIALEIGELDEWGGHCGRADDYHYHASQNYPYVLGGFHGEVAERGEQLDPQPRAQPFRPTGEPLRGAEITDFQKNGTDAYELTYRLRGENWHLFYSIRNGKLMIETRKGNQTIRNETFDRHDNRLHPPR